MVADLGDKPRRLPADVTARIPDHAIEMLAVEFSWQRAGRVLLIRIALALMPEHGAEAMRPE